MEQAATNTLAGLFAQLGVAGLILAVLIAGAAWYLKASRELREEKRGVINSLEAKIEKLREEIKDLTLERDRLQRELLDCQYPERGGGV